MKLIKLNSLSYCVAVDESLVIAFGSPPEWIKHAGGIPFPRYIFLGGTHLDNGYNYCEIEFPIYRNFFFNRQTKTHIVAPEENIEGLKKSTEEALLGPVSRGDDDASLRAGFFVDLLAVRENFSPSGRKLLLPDFAGFESYDGDLYRLGPLKIQRTGKDAFLLSRGREEIALELEHPGPSDTIPIEIPERKGLDLFCFDSGDGFSPGKECSSFLLKSDDALLIFDPSVGSFEYFREGMFDAGKIQGIFISHIHADHDQGLYRFLSAHPGIPVYACGLVHESLSRKISFFAGRNAADEYNLIRLETERMNELPVPGIDIACDYGFHSIPSAMMKLYFRSGSAGGTVLGYSGDTLYDPIRFRSEEFPREYRERIEGFFGDADIIVHEAGAGLIHTDPEDLVPFLDERQRLFWFHTPRTNDNGFSRGLILEKDRWVNLC